VFLSVCTCIQYLLCSQVFKKFGEAGLLGINKPTGCGGQGLDYKFQVESQLTKMADLLGINKPTVCGGQGLDYKFQGEKSFNKKAGLLSSSSLAAVEARGWTTSSR
jgi:hypothetical protein